MAKPRYSQIIERIFQKVYAPGQTLLSFKREAIIESARELEIEVPKNLGDVIYSFRSRQKLPNSITKTEPPGYEWLIQSEGHGLYAFSLKPALDLTPADVEHISIPDATPFLVVLHAQSDEQALLARIRYNRLIDLFTGVTCYHLQSHYRTAVPRIGQTETNDLYFGFDGTGEQYILPVQAKGLKEKMSRIQIENDFAIFQMKFRDLIAKPIGTMQTSENTIVLFEFGYVDAELTKIDEAHYDLLRLRDSIN